MLTTALLRRSWRAWLLNEPATAGPAWLQWAWTLLGCVFLAVLFTVLGFIAYADGAGAWRNLAGWWHWYQINLLITLCIGLTIHALFDIGHALLRRRQTGLPAGWRRLLFYTGIPMLGVLLGWPLGLWLVGGQIGRWFDADRSNVLAGMFLISLLMTGALYLFFDARSHRIQAERRATEARLKLLQGQIEPHFLFNTLANVVGLIESDAPRAKAMLESFVDYLRASLGGLRRGAHTLGDELALVEAYLQIVALRMGDRLAYEIDVPPSLRGAALPALTLQPLVENAVVHGLEPQVDGGRLRIVARNEGGRLQLRVEDNGRGLGAPPAPCHAGAGTALANIGERLSELFGDEAGVRIEAATPRGVCAHLSLPLHIPRPLP